MATFEWTIANLERAQDDYITIVHWRCDGVEGEHSIGAYGTVSFNQEEGEEIIAFADLTEETVLAWVKEHLGAEEVAKIEENRKGKVDAQVARKTAVVSGLPWASQ